LNWYWCYFIKILFWLQILHPIRILFDFLFLTNRIFYWFWCSKIIFRTRNRIFYLLNWYWCYFVKILFWLQILHPIRILFLIFYFLTNWIFYWFWCLKIIFRMRNRIFYLLNWYWCYFENIIFFNNLFSLIFNFNFITANFSLIQIIDL